VAVTEGNKVSAQIQFGYSVNGYGVGDLVAYVNDFSDAEADDLLVEYDDRYDVRADLRPNGPRRCELREAARIELGMRAFLEEGGFKAFTTTFEDLHGLAQLPGIAVQRLMAEGYGFGAEGDWKTAALLRSMKVMADGLEGGTSFMEDYTYHFECQNEQVLGAHMLEICESIAAGKPRLEMHPLGIGGKSDPARLVFNVPAGPAINVSIIDMGNRFRMIVNEVEAVEPEQPPPNLPVARVLWKPLPSLEVGAAAWILAGGAHHTGFSQAIDSSYMEIFAEMAGIEYLLIDGDTRLSDFKDKLRWNDMTYLRS
jgi:L-arabinose isomerase